MLYLLTKLHCIVCRPLQAIIKLQFRVDCNRVASISGPWQPPLHSDRARPTTSMVSATWAPVFRRPLSHLFTLSLSLSLCRAETVEDRNHPTSFQLDSCNFDSFRVQKVASPKVHVDSRPISVTSVRTRIMERISLSFASFSARLFSHQLQHWRTAISPTSSTTAALHAMLSTSSSFPFILANNQASQSHPPEKLVQLDSS